MATKEMYIKTQHERSYEDKIKQDEAELAKLEEEARKPAETPAPEPKAEEPSVETPAEPATKEEKGEIDWEKRYGDARRHFEKKKKELEAQIKESTGAPVLPASLEEVSEWETKYPDAANVIKSLAEQIAEKKLEEATDKIDQLETALTEDQFEKGMKKILAAHSDFHELEKDPVFAKWVTTQSESMQKDLFEGTNPDAAIRVIDFFKLETGTKKKNYEREVDLTAAMDVDTKGQTAINEDISKATYSESMIDNNDLAWYMEHEAEIDKAIKEGKFLYDKTKKK